MQVSLTLTQLFGNSASQTATELVIQKSDLAAVGLTPQANNHAEQLVVAILLQALRNFEGIITDENGNMITDENSIPIGYKNRELYELLEIFRWDNYAKQRGNQFYLTNTIVIESYVQAD